MTEKSQEIHHKITLKMESNSITVGELSGCNLHRDVSLLSVTEPSNRLLRPERIINILSLGTEANRVEGTCREGKIRLKFECLQREILTFLHTMTVFGEKVMSS